MSDLPLITLLTLTPLVGAMMVAGLEPGKRGLARGLGLLFCGGSLLLAGWLWVRFDPGVTQVQFVERHRWIAAVGAEYFVGLDGLGLLMVLLTALVVPFGLLASWRVSENTRAYVALLLFLQAGLYGAFTALNFFHWFIFWELSLVPAYFLIKLWGGPQRTRAATPPSTRFAPDPCP